MRMKPFYSFRTTLPSGFATIGTHDPQQEKTSKHLKKQNPEIKMLSFLDSGRWVRSILK